METMGKLNNYKKLICGNVIRLGDYINTDLIYPGAYLQLSDPYQIAEHALEGLSKDFPKKIRAGDIIVAGMNFGCGSSREGAVTCLKYAGIGAVIAKSFGRIFYRNMINQGFLPVECPAAVDVIRDGDELCIDVERGEIRVNDHVYTFISPPPLVQEIIRIGGLVPYAKQKKKKGD